jgi:HEAT repeat protein
MQKVTGICVLLLVLPIATSGCGQSRKIDYSVDKLMATLKDKDPKMRYWAAESLGHYGPEAHKAVPELIETLKDEDKMVRMGAAYALGEFGPNAAQAKTALEAAAKDPEKEVRDAADYALKRLAANP